jgi:hypothetical protein
VPPGEQDQLDRSVDTFLANHREPSVGKIRRLVGEVSRAASESLWWAVEGGTLGIASQLVSAAEITARDPKDHWRRPLVSELRRQLVEGAWDALIASVPLWARARMIEPVAQVDRRLLEDLLVHEQVPWLADQMRFELDLTPATRRQLR